LAQALLKGKTYLIVMGAALVLLLVAACGSDDSPDADSTGAWASGAELVRAFTGGGTNSNTGIWVNGRGEASGAPDLATVNLGVEALADTAAEARADAAVAIDGAIAVLRASGVADADIQTRFFNISPRYTTVEVTKCLDDVEEPVASASSAPSSAEAMVRQEKPGSECSVAYERKLIGYQVTNTLSVKVRDLDSVGEIIDGVTESAGDLTRVDGISFAIEDSAELQDEARVAAITDLQEKARQVAALAGVELGRLVYISESGGAVPVPFARFESDSFAGAAQATSFQAGELDVVVSVQGVFEIGNPVP
jgi:uncharacterized protein YggE